MKTALQDVITAAMEGGRIESILPAFGETRFFVFVRPSEIVVSEQAAWLESFLSEQSPSLRDAMGADIIRDAFERKDIVVVFEGENVRIGNDYLPFWFGTLLE